MNGMTVTSREEVEEAVAPGLIKEINVNARMKRRNEKHPMLFPSRVILQPILLFWN
jgi:hypothetical protein